MNRLHGLKTVAGALTIATLLSGCASPSLRSAVYRYGKDYALMDPISVFLRGLIALIGSSICQGLRPFRSWLLPPTM